MVGGTTPRLQVGLARCQSLKRRAHDEPKFVRAVSHEQPQAGPAEGRSLISLCCRGDGGCLLLARGVSGASLALAILRKPTLAQQTCRLDPVPDLRSEKRPWARLQALVAGVGGSC
jgi:hypothetical protein